MSLVSENKRIAKNTIWMYVRLFTTMFIGLYTSRVVLQVLGVSDYGLYSVVGGVLAMFTFISGSLMSATTRFLNFEMGKERGDVNCCFNINLLLHIALAVIIFILAETIGVWYIYNKLQVEPGKLGDAIFVYQVAIITTCLGIINEPYASLFNAFERFGFLATFDIVNTLIRFGCILLLQYSGDYALRLYCIIMSITTVNTFAVYHWIAARDWGDIIKFRLVRGWQHYREVLVFSNWNLLATVAMMIRTSGCDLIINAFFGTAVNGAFAVSKTVNNYIMSFSSNFDSAAGPQIVQSYSSGDYSRTYYLTNKLGRFSLLLFEMVFFPLYIELDFVLHLWLNEVPDGVLVFCQLNLLLAAVALTCGGIVQVISASGKIKWFKVIGGIFFLMSVVFGYILCKMGYPAYSLVIIFLVADLVYRIIQLILMKTILGFDSLIYVKEAYIRPAIIAVVMTVVLVIHSFMDIESVIGHLISIIFCGIMTAAVVYRIGLTTGEKTKLLLFIKNKVNQLI